MPPWLTITLVVAFEMLCFVGPWASSRIEMWVMDRRERETVRWSKQRA
jgi:hypothetical protein